MIFSKQFSVGSFQLAVFSKKLLVLIACLFSASLFSQGFEIPEKPKFQTSVYDYIELLTPNQKSNLESKLIRYSDTTSTQIVTIIINSTKGENINYLAANWGENWGFGDAVKDNGIIVLLAKDDRKIAIQAGKGTEHLLTDFQSKRIIERVIIPEFKRGDFYSGLNKGSDAIFQTLQGEFKGSREEEPNFDFGIIIFIFIIIILFIIISRGNKNNKRVLMGQNFDIALIVIGYKDGKPAIASKEFNTGNYDVVKSIIQEVKLKSTTKENVSATINKYETEGMENSIEEDLKYMKALAKEKERQNALSEKADFVRLLKNIANPCCIRKIPDELEEVLF